MIRQTVTVYTTYGDGVEVHPEIVEVEIDQGALYLRSHGATTVFAPGAWTRSQAVPA